MTAPEFEHHAAALLQSSRPLHAVFSADEPTLAFDSGRIPGNWEKVKEVDDVGIWKFVALREL